MFTGSRDIRDLYEPVAHGEFRSVVTQAFAAIGFAPGDELLARILTQPLGVRYAKWVRLVHRLQDFNLASREAQALRQFLFAQHILTDIPGGSPFDPETRFPDQLVEVADLGAHGLLEYGQGQFRVLRLVCDSLEEWASSQGHRQVLLLESPLGNVVPVAALSRLLGRKGIAGDVTSLSLPRDTRVVTYKDAIESLYADLAKCPRPLVYLDDVLTGSRFSKTVEALQKAARRHRQPPPVAVALVCPPHRPLTPAHEENRARAKEKVVAERHPGNPQVWWEMPGVPRFQIDSGPPIAYESPVVWGESDLVAGRRRVNFVFNLIEELKCIQEALVAEDPSVRTELRRFWSEDIDGRRYEVPDDVLRGGLVGAFRGLDWGGIATRAEEAFPDDYRGRSIPLPDTAFVDQRLFWLKEQVLETAAVAEPSGTHLGWNALYTLFQALDRRNGDPRDRDFCYMFYPYNPQMARLHLNIVEAVAG